MKTLIALLVLAAAQAPQPKQFLIRVERTVNDYNKATDEQKTAARAHFPYLLRLHAEGKIAFAGRVPDPKGMWGFMVVNAPDEASARAILDGDPAIKAGVYRGEVFPFDTVLDHRPTPAHP
jgi:uncharacterized protein YciI